AYRTRIQELLLAALAAALRAWTGAACLLVDVEGHGRDEIAAGLDVSRTVGWFTSIFPLALDLREETPAERLKAVKAKLRRIPRAGMGYGLLRYLGDEEAAARLRARPRSPVLFNYLGRLDRGAAGGAALWRAAPGGAGAERSRRHRRIHL